MQPKTELSTVEIVDAGVDYLRLTVKPGESVSGVMQVWQGLYSEAQDSGHKITEARMPRYRGTECGGLKILGREEDMMFEAEGAIANRAFMAMKGVEFHGNVPRIDAQATIDGDAEELPPPKELFQILQQMQEQSPSFAQVNLEFKKPAKTGHTVYVGARTSGCYARFYDAGARHRDRYTPTARRWELEMKDEVARDAYKMFQSSASTTCCAVSLVMGKLQSYNIRQSWFTADPPLKPFSGWKKTTMEGWLAHVDKCFARKFRQAINEGNADVLCEILGVKSLELRDEYRPTYGFGALDKRLTRDGLK